MQAKGGGCETVQEVQDMKKTAYIKNLSHIVTSCLIFGQKNLSPLTILISIYCVLFYTKVRKHNFFFFFEGKIGVLQRPCLRHPHIN